MYSGEQPSEERTRNSLKSSVRDRLVGVQRFKQEDNNNRAEATTGSMGGDHPKQQRKKNVNLKTESALLFFGGIFCLSLGLVRPDHVYTTLLFCLEPACIFLGFVGNICCAGLGGSSDGPGPELFRPTCIGFVHVLTEIKYRALTHRLRPPH